MIASDIANKLWSVLQHHQYSEANAETDLYVLVGVETMQHLNHDLLHGNAWYYREGNLIRILGRKIIETASIEGWQIVKGM